VILVDSSVWIAHFRGQTTAATIKFAETLAQDVVIVGDLILLELLRGARNGIHAAHLERELRQFKIVPLLDTSLAVQAARHYRHLRSIGITIRKTADLIIATYCITHNHELLHDDRDFVPMQQHLGLRVL